MYCRIIVVPMSRDINLQSSPNPRNWIPGKLEEKDHRELEGDIHMIYEQLDSQYCRDC
jgi:hypothetical protein